jgi:hypothetical protein
LTSLGFLNEKTHFIVARLPEPWEEESTHVLAEKYHVKRDRIAFCIVSSWDLGYEKGYNSVSVPAIEAKYSKRAFEGGMKKSVELYMQVHKPEGNLKQHCEEMLKKNENQ